MCHEKWKNENKNMLSGIKKYGFRNKNISGKRWKKKESSQNGQH